MDAEDARLREWIGRTETARDVIHSERARALQATLDREPLLRDGDALPPLWHWLYFWTTVPRSELGRDGHPALGGLPRSARRGGCGRVAECAGPGACCSASRRGGPRRSSTSCSRPARTGRLVFVTVRHEISGSAGLAIVDEHDIVYREDAGAEVRTRGGEPAPAGATFSRPMQSDTTMLFRYSALTFNGHRIHYDRDYATRVEGYSGLVVHGPLLATLMADLAACSRPDRPMAEFAFRGHRPVIDTDPFTVCGTASGDADLNLWVADYQGVLAMKGMAVFR